MRRTGHWTAIVWGSAASMSAASAQLAPVSAPPSPLAAPAAPPAHDRLSTLQPLALGSTVQRTTRISPNFRVRVSVAAVAAGARERMQQRVAGSMIDFYPLRDQGFHLSAGSRLYDVRDPAGTEAAGRGLLLRPRTANAPGPRAGANRSTPTLTMGYNGTVAADTTLGLELGAMQGRANAAAIDPARQMRGQRDRGSGAVNPLVKLVVGRRF